MNSKGRSRLGIIGGIGAGLGLMLGCGDSPPKRSAAIEVQSPSAQPSLPTEPVFPKVSELQKSLAAQAPLSAQAPSDAQKSMAAAMDAFFQRSATDRYYMHLDKPLYKPGESIWFRVWELNSASLTSAPAEHGTMVQLISPKGATVLEKRIRVTAGLGANDFVLPASVQGGEYTLRVISDSGGSAERTVIVSQYQAPRIKKKAEFLRKAYGPGDKVAAAISIGRATGEALANKEITAIVQVDSAEIARFPVMTNQEGNAIVKFVLPSSIAVGDGLMTLLVQDGGVTESLQKRIPITLQNLSFEMFPEGGDLIAGLPGRVYFSAKNNLGKPADVEGHVIDKSGNTISHFRSFHNGMGRFEISAGADDDYFAVIDKPVGIKGRFALPAVKASGCSMQSLDDYSATSEEVRVGVWCSDKRSIVTTALLREKRLGDYSFEIEAKRAQVLSFPVPAGSQGAVRVTLFDEDIHPLAERLVYRGRGRDLKVSVEPTHDSYSPRDQVELKVSAEDLAGKPVQADLSLSVVDDTVLSFADDKTAHMLTRLYLESEMPGQKIEEPNYYFSDKPRAAAGLDLVLGTQGWRRFEWQQVLAPPPGVIETTLARGKGEGNRQMPVPPVPRAPEPRPAPDAPKKDKKRPAPKEAPVRADKPRELAVAANREAPAMEAAAEERAMGAPMQKIALDDEIAMDFGAQLAGKRAKRAEEDRDWAGAEKERDNRWQWAAVRSFPAPNYVEGYDGPRTDFRETIHWAPSIKTDAQGEARVTFYLSDAVTSFRVNVEGVSQGGLPGRVEELVTSKLPVSLAVTMPLEVSKGDAIELPVTLSNETKRSYEVDIDSQFGAAFAVKGGVPRTVALAPGERKSFFAKLEVIGDGKQLADGLMRVAIDAGNLRDEVKREVRVVALGFPQELSLAGTVEKTAVHDFSLTGVIPNSIEASVTMYPSPLATMMSGTEAIIREPYGCFEQASSANYPNIMVLNYLEENAAADPALIEKTMAHLDKGYKMLTGYESPKKGYEWFGGDPGHEALTAYGLKEFVDMSKVYGDVDQGMIKRTVAWLKSRRDGKGGFKKNSRALDSFGRASDEVTNGYISYALSESGDTDLAEELAYQKKIAVEHSDPYLLALAANTLFNLEPSAGTTTSVLSKLAALQSDDGSFAGADHSITRSGGVALDLETTALATLALIEGGQTYAAQVRESVEWMTNNRSGFGGFGSTQSTVLTLEALTEYASATRVTQSDGEATIMVNGVASGTLRFEKGQKASLVFDDVAAALKPGKNTIELQLASESPLPYSIAISYRSKMPASSPETKVSIFTQLEKQTIPLGEGVRMNVSVKNLSDEGQPMTMARVGLPGGLTFQTWQLKELMDKKIIDFYETREREVILYFRSMAPSSAKEVPLELIARVPGEYLSPASRAYLYYTDEFKHWSEPVRVRVTSR